MAETSNPVQPSQPGVQPNFDLVDSRVQKALDARLLAHGGGGGNIGGMAHDERVSKLEVEVGTIKGSLDWAKIAFGLMGAVVLSGFAIVITIMLNLSAKTDAQITVLSGKVDGISTTITEEFRTQRADQAAQTSAVANAIIAAQQRPSVVMLQPLPTDAPKLTEPVAPANP